MSPEGVDAQGRPIWGGYVQDQSGNWVRPDTGGGAQASTQNIGPEGVDGQGRPIWGGYVQDQSGNWVEPSGNTKREGPAGSQGLDAMGRPIWGGYVQDQSGAWINPQKGTDALPGRGSNYGGGASDAFPSGPPGPMPQGPGRDDLWSGPSPMPPGGYGNDIGGPGNDPFSNKAAPSPWLGGMNALTQAIDAQRAPAGQRRMGWP